MTHNASSNRNIMAACSSSSTSRRPPPDSWPWPPLEILDMNGVKDKDLKSPGDLLTSNAPESPSSSKKAQEILNRVPARIKKPTMNCLTEDNEGIIYEMRCSFCKGAVPPPLRWVCTVGHLICHDCKELAPYCPWEPRRSRNARNMCRREFCPTKLRFYNVIYKKSKFECHYKSNGCPETPNGREYWIHVETCKFKPPPSPTPIPALE